MIGKVSRGWRVGGLIRYLLGPGRFTEHTDPRVIASWDGRPSAWQPPHRPDGRVDVTDLTAALAIGQVVAGIPQHEPAAHPGGKTPLGPVWHCSLRNHPDDPILTDRQWRDIAREVMHRTGIAPRDDHAGCRWVVVRHAENHVHIAAVLVRLDTGRRVHPKFDHRTVRQVCRETETRLDLTPTSDADRTAPRYPTRAEQEKAARSAAKAGPSGDLTGGRSAREFLCEQARRAALHVHSPQEFLELVASPAVKVRVHRDRDGQIDGYALALVGDHDAAGNLVWFSGSRLARDLSLPRLRAVWASAEQPPPRIPAEPHERSRPGRAERPGALDDATHAVRDATDAVRDDPTYNQPPTSEDDQQAATGDQYRVVITAGIAHSLRDLLVALDLTAHHAYPDLGDAARLFDRAARTPRTVLPERWSEEARHLRTAAWRLTAARVLPGRGPDREPLAALVAAIAALIAELAAYQATKQRLAQAHAAHRSADALVVAGEGHQRGPRPQSGGAEPTHTASNIPWAVAQASRSASLPRSRRTGPSGGTPRPSPPPTAPQRDPRQRPGPGRSR